MLQILYKRVAGLDVHKKTVVATRMRITEEDRLEWEVWMANLTRGRMRNKIPELEKALTGLVGQHHRFLLAKQLAHIDFLGEQISDMGDEIARQIEAMPPLSSPPGPDASEESEAESAATEGTEAPLTWAEAVALLDTMPGVNQRTAEVILAEMGLDMGRFPTDKHLAAWAGLAPGNHQSGGKRYSGRTTKGNQALSSTMVQAAWSAVRTKGTFLKSRYHRLAARRGKKRAIVAVAHSMLVSAWHMLTYRQPYQELGGDYFDQRKKETKIGYHVRQLEKLSVHLDRSPDVAHDARPGVGGEGRPALEVVALNGTPEADATRLQGLGEGQVAQHLPAHDDLHQAIVTPHQGVQAVGTSRLRPLEQSGLGKSAEATHRLVVNVHWAPP